MTNRRNKNTGWPKPLRKAFVLLSVTLIFTLLFSIPLAAHAQTLPKQIPVAPHSTVPYSMVYFAEASSVYELKYNTEYTVGADMVVDGLLETAWNEGGKDDGINEWIKLAPVDGQEYTYSGFEIANGFQYHDYYKGDRWEKNNRVRFLLVYDDTESLIGGFPIDDRSNGYQTVYFAAPVSTTTLRFEIVATWQGSSFTDTCISEIHPF